MQTVPSCRVRTFRGLVGIALVLILRAEDGGPELGDLAVMSAKFAGDRIEPVSYCGGPSGGDDGTASMIAWSVAEDGSLRPLVQVRAPERVGSWVYVELRTSHAGMTRTVVSGARSVEAIEEFEVDLEPLVASLSFDPGQRDWLSPVRATLVEVDGGGHELDRVAAPMVWLAVERAGVSLLDTETAAEVAPGGGFSAEAAALVVRAQGGGDDEFVASYEGGE